MKAIGIICAMEEERDTLLKYVENPKEERAGGISVYTGTLSGKPVALCCSGMGKVNAGAATQLLISRFDAGAIINSGIAGNMTRLLGIGDVAISTSVVYHDGEPDMISQSYPYTPEPEADPELIAAAAQACRALGVKCATGRIATGDKFIGDSVTKGFIYANWSPICVEMEGAAVGHIAAKNDVPFVVIRAMSDNADEVAHETLVVQKFDVTAYCAVASDIAKATVERFSFDN